ncbi:MAG: hypothetical protein J5614_09380, partial [Paludibacteraceae bacterium]|nr:hypothetical protein [Paludibacteraceae bacterium]
MIEFTKTKYCPEIFNVTYTAGTIIDPYKYYKSNNQYVHIRCACCGKDFYAIYHDIYSNHTKSCGHCYDNKFIIVNDLITIIKIYDHKQCEWKDVIINTDCVEYIKRIGNIWINRNSLDKSREDLAITINHKTVTLSRIIVNYINSVIGINIDISNYQIDHINGDTYNNLYTPFDNYYNNLRICTQRQNLLNRECFGY